jgi:hypothetical protein
MKPTWYISFEARDSVTARHYRRETRTFTTETQAKAFARAIFARSARLAAGTINPVRPKRVIASKQGLSEWFSLT